MRKSIPLIPGLCAAAVLGLAGCEREPPDGPRARAGSADAEDPYGLAAYVDRAPALGAGSAAGTLADDAPPPDTLGDQASLAALVDDGEIPYPLYPSGVKYRVGGQNGLTIVLFETDDSFAEVDAFYRERSEETSMPRLEGMDGYARYPAGGDDDTDPWATDRPGIVIHRFEGEAEREAVGAGDGARTNIIMSY